MEKISIAQPEPPKKISGLKLPGMGKWGKQISSGLNNMTSPFLKKNSSNVDTTYDDRASYLLLRVQSSINSLILPRDPW
jgi:hypothetical protein